MNLSAPALQLEISPLQRASDEDWCRVRVDVQALRFKANFEAYLQRADLERFVAELEAMHRAVGTPATATLCSAEPNIYLRLNMQRLGGITAEYKFSSEEEAGGTSTLSGNFEMDQSYLPTLGESVQTLISQLSGANAA